MSDKGVLCLFFYSVLFANGGKTAEVLKIGAIFDTKDDFAERAFTYAIEQINENDGGGQYIFDYIIKRIQYDNSFEALRATCALLEDGVIGILGPKSEENSNVVQSICDAKEIPHIEVRWDDRPLNGTIVNLHPYPDILTKLYVDLLTVWGWTDFVILYENNESLFRVGELIKLYRNQTNRIAIRQLDKSKTGDYRPLLKEVWRSGATHFMLDCSIDILEEVLRQAQQVGLITNQYHYIITNLDLHTIETTPFWHSSTNITGMRFLDPDDGKIRNVAYEIYRPFNLQDSGLRFSAGWKLRLEYALIYDAILMFAEAIKGAPPFKPTELNCEDTDKSWTMGQTVVNLMKLLTYPGLSGKVKFDTKGFRTEFGLEVTEFREGGIVKVANWNSTASDRLNTTRDYKESENGEMSLVNQTFKVLITLTDPYGMYKESFDQLGGNDRYEGFGIDLIHELSLLEGFNYKFILREDGKNGVRRNGTWTGMIGDIIHERADLAVTDLTITSDRSNAVDFTSPFMNLGISILFQKPKRAPPSFFSFADPFAFEVWKLVGVAFFAVSIALFVLGRICQDEWTNPYPCIEEPEYLVNQLSLRNCFWFVTGSIMQQGSEIAPLAVPTRMVAGMWWFFTLIMVSSYTANLAAFLTTTKPEYMFQDVNELVKVAKEKGIKYGAKGEGATAFFFRDSQDPVHQKIWKYMEENKNEVMVTSNDDGVKKVENASYPYAFFMESVTIEYVIERHCGLDKVGHNLDEKGYGIAMRKNMPYRQALTKAVTKLQENGKLSELKRKWWQERKGGGLCRDEDKSGEAIALNLENVGGVFWVTIGGSLLACVCVFIELILHVVKESIKTKTPFKQALKDEISFYFKFAKLVKPVMYNSTNSLDAISNQTEGNEYPYSMVKKQNSRDTTGTRSENQKTFRCNQSS